MQVPASQKRRQTDGQALCKDNWVELSQHIEKTPIVNIRAMNEGIKVATGPTKSKSDPLKSSSGELSVDKGKQMDRWKKHYSDLYRVASFSNQTVVFYIEKLSSLLI